MSSPVKWLSDRQYESATLPERMVAWADSQVGVKEVPKGSNRGPMVDEYEAYYGLKGQPWCACFVAWCMNKAGFSKSQIGKSALVADWANQFKGKRVETPKRGDLGYWVTSKGTGHIFIVVGYALGVVRTIEGNTNDDGSREGYEVCKRTRGIWGIRANTRWGFIRL